ncbi:hypothetical protein EQG63_09205 [Flavobacterium amnicola]|uniref:Uncharacterized protein n=1 Tax=Flavobacterium amnicola TaxID=2506422 RepID=A0A4Q1K1U2_9FLAO|nr:DUF5995 family protein [Flavobacterium amnicola]RXR18433.1 hypothetical protein EQG63_09205 [Flavobacterium amnicola]
MECKTIDEVLLTLDKIVEDCKTNNCPLGLFAVLYRKVTQNVKQGIKNNRFEDNIRMEKLDVLFANRYFKAYFDYKNNQSISKSWKVAFNAKDNNSYIALQHLLLGINAHINLDLGIATIQTIEDLPLDSIQNDFNHINRLLSDMTDEVKKNMGSISPVFGVLMPLAKRWDDKLIQFSIEMARDGAWEFSNCLYSDENKAASIISERDSTIEKLGIALLNPVRTLQWILNTIRFFESKSMALKIEILENKMQNY